MEIKKNLTSEQTAERVGIVSGAALEVRRCRGDIDIPFIRVGKRGIRYDPDDVEKWLNDHKEFPGQETEKKKPAGRTKRQRRLRGEK